MPNETPAISKQIRLLGNYYFNTYLIEGSHSCAIVETGVSAIVDLLISQLEVLGRSPDYIIVTHPHADHITGLPGLTERFPKARVIAGNGAKKFVEHPKAVQSMFTEDAYMSAMLAKRGIHPGREPLNDPVNLSGSIAVDGDLSLDLGGVSLDCMSVKGHSPGNIAVHVPDEKTLLVSDSLGFRYPGRGICPLFFTGLSSYLDTIRLFKNLSPNVIGPGHQGPVQGDKAELILNQAVRAVTSVVETSVDPAKTMDEAVEELFNTFYVDEFHLYTRENIMNCMQLLVKRARDC